MSRHKAVLIALLFVIAGSAFATDELPRGALAIVCADDAACTETRNALALRQSKNRYGLDTRFEFVEVRRPRPDWFFYYRAKAVVVATQVSTLTNEQRLAIEQYLRFGGNLVLLGNEIGKSEFLSAYRGTASLQWVGRGQLLDLPSVSDKNAALLFSPDAWSELELRESMRWSLLFSSGKHLWSPLNLPPTWLLALAIAIYVGVVAVLTLRSGVHHVLYASVTVVAFAVVLVGIALGYRPPQSGVDEVSVYWTDDRADTAAVQSLVRLFSGRPERMTIRVPENAEGLDLGEWNRHPSLDVLRPVTHSKLEREARKLDVSLPAWSFEQHFFGSFESLSGGITVNGTELHNGTNYSYTKAVFTDQKTVWEVGSLASGQTVNLETLPSHPLTYTGGGTWVEYYRTPLRVSKLLTADDRWVWASPEHRAFVGLFTPDPLKLGDMGTTRTAILVAYIRGVK